jgi:hypothetical protein
VKKPQSNLKLKVAIMMLKNIINQSTQKDAQKNIILTDASSTQLLIPSVLS